jgi:heme/copper-type cytochrome/quinol oxidase subunit 4
MNKGQEKAVEGGIKYAIIGGAVVLILTVLNFALLQIKDVMPFGDVGFVLLIVVQMIVFGFLIVMFMKMFTPYAKKIDKVINCFELHLIRITVYVTRPVREFAPPLLVY